MFPVGEDGELGRQYRRQPVVYYRFYYQGLLFNRMP